jgi:hypothetical protein
MMYLDLNLADKETTLSLAYEINVLGEVSYWPMSHWGEGEGRKKCFRKWGEEKEICLEKQM